jgi:hypothetical protein
VPKKQHPAPKGYRLTSCRANFIHELSTFFVDVEAIADVIAVISNCPQKYNPACGYNPSPVRVETYSRTKKG